MSFLLIFLIAGCAVAEQSPYTDMGRTFSEYVNRTKYMDHLVEYIKESEGVDLVECGRKSDRKKIVVIERPVFKQVLSFLTFSSHPFGHPVNGKWTDEMDISNCGGTSDLKVLVTADNGNPPIFETTN